MQTEISREENLIALKKRHFDLDKEIGNEIARIQFSDKRNVLSYKQCSFLHTISHLFSGAQLPGAVLLHESIPMHWRNRQHSGEPGAEIQHSPLLPFPVHTRLSATIITAHTICKSGRAGHWQYITQTMGLMLTVIMRDIWPCLAWLLRLV